MMAWWLRDEMTVMIWLRVNVWWSAYDENGHDYTDGFRADSTNKSWLYVSKFDAYQRIHTQLDPFYTNKYYN